MSYPKPPRFCNSCGRDSRDGYKISYNGNCEECATRKMATAITEMATNKGKTAEKWRRNRHNALRRELAMLDAQEASERDSSA